MLTYGKSYTIERRTGERDIYRGGERVGSWPEVGFALVVKGVVSASVGTELAGHALAEILRGVAPWSRRWVLTEEEYREHMDILEGDRAALMQAFPFTAAEAASVAANEDKYSVIVTSARERNRLKFLNLDRPEYLTWGYSLKPRPEMPEIDEPDVETAPRM